MTPCRIIIAALALVLARPVPAAEASNAVANPGFDQQLATSVSTMTQNLAVGTAQQFWEQTLLGGSYVQSFSEDSDNLLAGSSGKMMRILTDSTGSGSGGTTITAFLNSQLPPGAKGRIDVRVISGSARIGFLRETGANAEFLPGSVLVSGGGVSAPWQHVSWTGTGTATQLAVRVFAPEGGVAELCMDNAVASPAVAPRASRYDYTGYFGPMKQRISGFCHGDEVPAVGDFNGDGRADLVTFWKNTHPGSPGPVRVAFSYYNGGQFQYGGYGHPNFCVNDEIPAVGDFDGDGRDDIISFDPASGKVWVALAGESGFATSREWYDTGTNGVFMAHAGQTPLIGDFNGDQLDDVALFGHGPSGFVFVAVNNGRGFGALELWFADFCKGAAVPRAGDVNGDGRDDIVSFVRDSDTATAGDVEVALSNSTSFGFGGSGSFAFAGARFWHQNFAPSADYEPLLADLNGDGSADIVAARDTGEVFCAVKTAANSFASGPGGTETADPHWQWHHDARNPNERIFAARCNADLNDDLILFVRSERAGNEEGGVFTSLCGGHAEPEPESKLADFGYAGAFGATQGSFTVPLLVLNSEVIGNARTRTAAEIDQGVFGPAHPNLVSWVNEMSRGSVTLTRGGMVSYGPINPALAGEDTFRWHLELACDSDGPGGFEMRNFDANDDGVVDLNELRILALSTSDPRGAGKHFWFNTTIFPGDPSRSVTVGTSWAYSGEDASLDNMAHEITHGFGMHHIYGALARAEDLSIGSATAGSTAPTRLIHLDPYNKMRMGWSRPAIYDIAHFPAGAAIAPAQSTFPNPPVILYDSTRGTHEYHLVEHRNGAWTGGTQTWTPPNNPASTWRPRPRSSFPAAGYDIDVRDNNLSFTNQGFVVWSVKTDASHDILDIPQGILAGPDDVLDSVPSGDDVYWPSAENPSQIHCGPNSTLDSPVLDDDTTFQDAFDLPMTNPADIPGRQNYRITPSGPAPTTLQYYDATDSGVIVQGDAPHGEDWQFIEWGRNFRPYIDGFHPPAVARGGSVIAVTGNLGNQLRYRPRLISPDGTRIIQAGMTTESWSGVAATFTIPRGDYPSGKYRFQIFDGLDYEGGSNTHEINLEGPWDTWLAAHFTLAERDDPAISGISADPDHDGMQNLVEALLGTDPMANGTSPIEWEVSRTLIRATFPADFSGGGGTVTLQVSSDLVTWTDRRMTSIGTGEGTTSVTLQVTDDFSPRSFARLKFSRQ